MRQPALPGAAAKRYVAELAIGERVDTTFLLRRCDLRTRQSGDPYLALQFSDKSGTVSARMWDGAEAAARAVKEGDYVRVGGAVETWQSQPQIKVDRLEPAETDSIDPADFLPTSERDIGEMYDELLAVVDSVRNEHLQALLRATFGDPQVAALFRRAPGGVMLHTDIPSVSEPFDAFMMEWETLNSNENFAATFRETDLAAVATEVGFAEGQARMENMPRIMEAKKQAYSDRAITWPVLVGEK